MKKNSSFRVSKSLQLEAKRLRKEFETTMRDAHSPDRFKWDFWHLPGRYTHLRTPAAGFFTSELHDRLVVALRKYGREELGCPDVSPLWLSCYVEGCEQRLHADRPHGPWAFVLSLTPDSMKFSGGETMLVRPEVLSLWSQGVPRGKAFEESEIVDRIPSRAGQLLVFDPRIPHGVSRVSGTMDPLEGRLVVHGWFTQPNPFVDGPLSMNAAEKSLIVFDEVLALAFRKTAFHATGTIAFQIHVGASGKVAQVRTLASSLSSAEPEHAAFEIRKLSSVVTKHFSEWRFPKRKTKSVLSLPLSFERG